MLAIQPHYQNPCYACSSYMNKKNIKYPLNSMQKIPKSQINTPQYKGTHNSELINPNLMYQMPAVSEKSMIYLAVPYTHKDPHIQYDRFVRVNRVAASLMQKGSLVFSPISHGHSIATAGELPGDWQYWESHCRTMLRICKKVIVLMLDGWEESTGVKNEIRIAKEMGIPVEYMEPSLHCLNGIPEMAHN